MLSKRLIASRSHPFRLLLILEWILLAISALQLFGLPGWYQTLNAGYEPKTSVLEILLVFGAFVLLGMMGLRLPTNRWGKVIYIAITLILIAITCIWSLTSLASLLVIVLLRSCLIFQHYGKWIVFAFILLIYPLTLAPIILIFWLIFSPENIQDWQLDNN